MTFCQAYGCDKRATCHGVLCDRHWALAGEAHKENARYCRTVMHVSRSVLVSNAYVMALDTLVANVNRQLTPPAGAAAARPEPKGPAGGFSGSPFSTPPPRNRVEEI